MHVLDASRAAGVVGALMGEERRAFAQKNLEKQDEIRQAMAGGTRRPLMPYDEARAQALKISWRQEDLAQPQSLALHEELHTPLEDIVPYIDWTPLFHAWELKGRYPAIFDKPEIGLAARELFDNAQALLRRIVTEKRLTAQAVWQFFAAASEGDDIVLYEGSTPRARLCTIRQQQVQTGAPTHALADFIAPRKSSEGGELKDFLGAFVVTAGIGLESLVAEFEAQDDDYNAIMVKALADRLAEAYAEMLHEKARHFCGFGTQESLSKEELIGEKYRGIRPAPGYPACPDHLDKRLLFDLVQAPERIGVTLTESCAMLPAASVSGWYFNHPKARYFGVGKLGRDQIENLAVRKGYTVEELERWLQANLGYE
ncbi:MAG: vitamin B12 dependent-methionine synthase activation domain-containing protein [Myxococcota bacterium]